ncbi:hypothetical protein HMPREF9374_3501, partial [Desmospora sp. 8437]
KAVGIGFHIAFRCSYEPKSLHVKPNPPYESLFHNASRVYLINLWAEPVGIGFHMTFSLF